MGKGYRRKTRWRTLNIGESPDKEDEENNVQTTREHSESNHRFYHKKNNTTNTNDKSNDSAETSPQRFQQKVMFNENEYTKINTPRQDMLFKKGYLAKKMVYSSNNPSTSATPSTTDSQSASHSTADGSEITEDQQLYDYRDNGFKEYQSMNGLVPEMVYGTFYDPIGGYYYEYPVMVGPIYPDTGLQNVIPSIPCEAVPLGPVQWINPSYDYYENAQATNQVITEDDSIALPMTTSTDLNEKIKKINDEKCTCDVIDKEEREEDEDSEQQNKLNWEVPYDSELVTDQTIVSNDIGFETEFSQQLQISHPVVPLQPHIYPGPYMFINIDGMPILNNSMRGTDMNPGNNIYPKRRNRRRMRSKKAFRLNHQDNNGDYSQDYEGFNSETDNLKQTTDLFISKSQPLNPDCEEFKLKTITPNIEANIIDDDKDIKINEEKINNSSSKITIPDVEYAIEAISTEKLSEPEETEIGIDVACIEINDNFKNDDNNDNNKISMNVPNNETNDSVKLLNGNKIDKNLTLNIHENNESSYYKNNKHMIPKNKYKNHKNNNNNNEIKISNDDNDKQNDNNINNDVKIINNDIEVMLGVEATELQVADNLTTENSSLKNNNCNVTNNDSNFEHLINNISDHPITDAVTQWLRRANSPELFVGLKMSTVNTNDNNDDDEEEEEDNDDDDDDDYEKKPSKNLQGNPMLALSFNNIKNKKNIKFTINMNNENIIKNIDNKFYYYNNNNCKFNNKKDSVASMRVAENTRFNIINKFNNNDYKNQSIKFNSVNRNFIKQITNN